MRRWVSQKRAREQAFNKEMKETDGLMLRFKRGRGATSINQGRASGFGTPYAYFYLTTPPKDSRDKVSFSRGAFFKYRHMPHASCDRDAHAQPAVRVRAASAYCCRMQLCETGARSAVVSGGQRDHVLNSVLNWNIHVTIQLKTKLCLRLRLKRSATGLWPTTHPVGHPVGSQHRPGDREVVGGICTEICRRTMHCVPRRGNRIEN